MNDSRSALTFSFPVVRRGPMTNFDENISEVPMGTV
jgi:hypothetical protein